MLVAPQRYRSNHAYPVFTQKEIFPVTAQAGHLLNGQGEQALIRLRSGLARIYCLLESSS